MELAEILAGAWEVVRAGSRSWGTSPHSRGRTPARGTGPEFRAGGRPPPPDPTAPPPESSACRPETRRCPSSECRRPAATSSSRSSRHRRGPERRAPARSRRRRSRSSRPKGSGACTDARMPAARASPRRASTTAGGIFGNGGFGRAAPGHVVEHQLDLGGAERLRFAHRPAGLLGRRRESDSDWLSGGSPWSHQPPFVVKIGAAGSTSGTSERSRDEAARACEIADVFGHEADRRDAPARASSGGPRRTPRARGRRSSPGTIHSPAASTTSVPAGRSRRSRPASPTPTDTIRPSETTRRAFRSGGAPVPSTSVAPRMAIVVASRMDPLTPGRPDLLGLERVLFLALLFLDLDRIDAREARRAGGLLRPAEGLEHALDGEIAEAVGLDELADLVDGLVGGDQLVARRRVDAVVAALDGRRGGDADVDLSAPRPRAACGRSCATSCPGRWNRPRARRACPRRPRAPG